MKQEIGNLWNKQLSIYYRKNLEDLWYIKNEIANNLYETLKIEIDNNRLENTEIFANGIENFENYLSPETKDSFTTLVEQDKHIKKEIKKRQIQLLKDIGITTPSIRVLEIVKKTEGEYFSVFSDMIEYIKLLNTGRSDERPKDKKIFIPKNIIDIEKKLKTAVLSILKDNIWPLAN